MCIELCFLLPYIGKHLLSKNLIGGVFIGI